MKINHSKGDQRMQKVNPIPEGQRTPTPYLTVRGAAAAIEFYAKVFGATELFRLTGPDGKIGHAEIAIGNSQIMLSDEHPDFGALSPQTVGGCPIKMHLYVEDADEVVERAVKAGATLLRPLTDEFYGDRTGMIADPFGYSWFIATRKEDVAPEEMQRRWSAVFENAG
ncbi:MAG TPA: VOC family protein [Blastocatellia bacterium]|nr:VOC family protein [Blastocatellia bacterium]